MHCTRYLLKPFSAILLGLAYNWKHLTESFREQCQGMNKRITFQCKRPVKKKIISNNQGHIWEKKQPGTIYIKCFFKNTLKLFSSFVVVDSILVSLLNRLTCPLIKHWGTTGNTLSVDFIIYWTCCKDQGPRITGLSYVKLAKIQMEKKGSPGIGPIHITFCQGFAEKRSFKSLHTMKCNT